MFKALFTSLQSPEYPDSLAQRETAPKPPAWDSVSQYRFSKQKRREARDSQEDSPASAWCWHLSLPLKFHWPELSCGSTSPHLTGQKRKENQIPLNSSDVCFMPLMLRVLQNPVALLAFLTTWCLCAFTHAVPTLWSTVFLPLFTHLPAFLSLPTHVLENSPIWFSEPNVVSPLWTFSGSPQASMMNVVHPPQCHNTLRIYTSYWDYLPMLTRFVDVSVLPYVPRF